MIYYALLYLGQHCGIIYDGSLPFALGDFRRRVFYFTPRIVFSQTLFRTIFAIFSKSTLE